MRLIKEKRLKTKELVALYKDDAMIQSLADATKANERKIIHAKGIVGSQDAIIGAAIFELNHQNHVFVLEEKEEAAYFHNDLQNLLSHKEVLFFPTSYKRPYQFEETENANILMRAEILNKINHKSTQGELIVTYPEALTEKVINKRSLLANTFSASVGEKVDVSFLSDLLITYDFEKTDFVYEPGQFAVRGGIIDVFSYSGEHPYRIELFGDEVESIRTFDPINQLSLENQKRVNIIPNIQTKLLKETRQSFLDYIPNNSKIWIKDLELTKDIIDKYYSKASSSFESIIELSGETQIVFGPEALFETSETFSKELSKYVSIQFGNRFHEKSDIAFAFDAKPQPPFQKNFEMMVDHFAEYTHAGFRRIIAADNAVQIDRLNNIFEELNAEVDLEELNIDLRKGFIDNHLNLLCYTDHQLLDRFHRYKVKEKSSKSKALTLKELKNLNPGDYVVHIDYGVGRFAGLDSMDIKGNKQEALRLIYRDNDLLYIPVQSLHKISKYAGKEGAPPSISKLGSPEWENKKTKVRKKVKDIAKDLIGLYAKRKQSRGYAYPKDDFLQVEMETSFIYQDTPDQASSTSDVKEDMEKPNPMDRLICGDVGFGKTEVAMRAAFKAAANGKQVAVLVPTTILAMQHNRTFKERLENFPIRVEYINRFRTTKEINEILEGVKSGDVDILIGTHRVVNKDVVYKDLGLLIIDEEQKFGVKVKDKLKEFKVNVDVLTLTATPIPRTLHFSMMGARDLSIIATPPPNRQPVTTELQVFNEEVIRDAISYEIRRGGQVFFVHNRVGDIEGVANIVHKVVPDARIGIAHGQMDGAKLEKAMIKFLEGEYDVLVSTNIIESGLDVPNANSIIINNAHHFGMSDLHQMRGRVGRSNKKAFCYLLSPPTSTLTGDARKRLNTLEEFSDLGDGFKVAMRDLDIRGAGNLLGGEQSGFITDIGFETYHQILDDTVQELKETDFKDLFADELKDVVKTLVTDCTIETDLEMLIPESYVKSVSERLSLYAKLDDIKDEAGLDKFCQSLIDRFGPIPEPVEELIKTVRLRWKAISLGIEKLVLKNQDMKCYLPTSDNDDYYKSDMFGKILSFVQINGRNCRMKDTKKRLIIIISEIASVGEAIAKLEAILK